MYFDQRDISLKCLNNNINYWPLKHLPNILSLKHMYRNDGSFFSEIIKVLRTAFTVQTKLVLRLFPWFHLCIMTMMTLTWNVGEGQRHLYQQRQPCRQQQQLRWRQQQQQQQQQQYKLQWQILQHRAYHR